MMKKILSLLLLLCSVGLTNSASAQSKPKFNLKRAFSHANESSKGKTSKARFRKVSWRGDFLDLHFHNIAKFETARSNKNYRFREAR
jgi:hypothetical protein